MLTDKESVLLLDLRSSADTLNEKGKAELSRLEKANLPETTALERGVIGFGRGMLDVYQGAKQKGLQAGEWAGLADPGSAQTYTEQVNRDSEHYRRLSEAHPWSTNIGRFAGNVAAAPVGGYGAGAARIATSGLLGGGIGAIGFTPSGETGDAFRQGAFGLLGGAVGEGFGMGLGRLAQRPGLPPLNPATQLAVQTPSLGSAGRAAAYTPEYGMPQTAGQASGSIPAQQFEQRVQRGTLGDPAAQQLDEFIQGQQAS
jgi:hypothetical protein